MLAKVIDVDEPPLGTELELDAAPGVSAITVSDINAMDWGGGQLAMADVEIKDYTVAGAENPESDEIDADDDPDPEGGTVNLTTPLAFGPYPAGTPVLLYPRTLVRIAYCSTEDQDEPVEAIVPDPLLDRIVTGTRSDDTAETVEIELVDDEWQVTDLVGEEGLGLARTYGSVEGVVTVDGTEAAPTVITTATVDIPNTAHRVLIWYYGLLDAQTGMVVDLGLDDNGFDFAIGDGFQLASYNADLSGGPVDALPILPQTAQGTAWVPPESGGVRTLAEIPVLPSLVMPYGVALPTPGLHTFRLVAWLDVLSVGTGTGSVTDGRLWVTLL